MPDRGKVVGRLLEGATGQDEVAATAHSGKRDAGGCARRWRGTGPRPRRWAR